MRYAVRAVWMLVCLAVMTVASGAVPNFESAWAGSEQIASVQDRASPTTVPAGSFAGTPQRERPNMSYSPTKLAQMRCPSGTLLFLSNSCGCNGACCACSQQARYLNNCTCQCQQAPPAAGSCRLGFSVGSQ